MGKIPASTRILSRSSGGNEVLRSARRYAQASGDGSRAGRNLLPLVTDRIQREVRCFSGGPTARRDQQSDRAFAPGGTFARRRALAALESDGSAGTAATRAGVAALG